MTSQLRFSRGTGIPPVLDNESNANPKRTFHDFAIPWLMGAFMALVVSGYMILRMRANLNVIVDTVERNSEVLKSNQKSLDENAKTLAEIKATILKK